MKILFIVLLIAAVWAGVYFYFSKPKQQSPSNSRELIMWKMEDGFR